MRNTSSLSLPFLVVCAAASADASTPAQPPDRAAIAPSWDLPLPEDGSRLPRPEERISVYVVLEGKPALEAVPAGTRPDSPAGRAMVRREAERLREYHKTVVSRLRDHGAVFEADLVKLANAVQVRMPWGQAQRIASLPGVISVERVPVYRRALKSAVPFVGAPALWSNAGMAVTGRGVRIGIVDTGIDYLHADFGGPGTAQAYQDNDRTVVEPGTFPTAKVLGGKDFVGDDYNGENAVAPDPDPLDCAMMQSQYISGGHGTHVAGIAAGMGVLTDGTTFMGPYEASYDPSIFRVGPGVAPEASLYALKIFGCDGSTTMVAAALEWAVDPNDDGDTSDRLDVVNMSLGGSYGIATPTDEKVVANLTAAGTMVVVAAGNDGDAFYSVGEPSTYTPAMSVAATTDVVTFLALRVEAPSSIAGDMACSEGAFTRPLSETGPISGQLVAAKPAGACSALSNGAEVQGKIAFIDRGGCFFVDKVKNAYDAGAIAVVVANNAPGEPPFAMGGDPGSQAPIPGVMIAKDDGDTIRSGLAQGVMVTLDASRLYQSSAGADQMAEFSSRGPRSQDNRLKPDVAAPGVSLDSAGVASGADAREMSGTSMACPMAAGAAALVREANPAFGPFDVKAAMMNYTAPVTDGAGHQVPVSLAGAGRIHVDKAAMARATAAAGDEDGAISLSFGSFVVAQPATSQRTLVVTNHTDDTLSYQATVEPAFIPAGVQVQVEPMTVQVPKQGSAQVTVTLSVDPSALPVESPDPVTPASISLGGQSYARHFLTEATGILTLAPVGSPGAPLRVPLHAVVRAGSELMAGLPARCADQAGDDIEIAITGTSLHKEPVTSAYQLAATSPVKPIQSAADRATDLTAVGVATNVATAENFDKASVYFGLAVDGEWTTPAKGQLSLVGVAIDTNADQKEDYVVFAEPLSRDTPADVLTATTYNLATGEVVSRRFLNLVPRDVYNTEPFNNSVVMLPVTLGTIGLTQANSAFHFYAFTQGVTVLPKDKTDWIAYDPMHAAVDTAVHGVNGIPYFAGYTPVRVRVDRQAVGVDPVPSILLLFHSNVQGKRWAIVDPNQAVVVPPGNLVIDVSAPARVKPSAEAEVAWTVTNAAADPSEAARLEVSIEGADAIEEATAPEGATCTTNHALVTCALAPMDPGAKASGTIRVRAADRDIHALASVATSPDCDVQPADNTTSATVAVGAEEPQASGGSGGSMPAYRDRDVGAYEPTGGCVCTLGTGRSQHGTGATALAAIGVAWWLVRRRAKRARLADAT